MVVGRRRARDEMKSDVLYTMSEIFSFTSRKTHVWRNLYNLDSLYRLVGVTSSFRKKIDSHPYFIKALIIHAFYGKLQPIIFLLLSISKNR